MVLSASPYLPLRDEDLASVQSSYAANLQPNQANATECKEEFYDHACHIPNSTSEQTKGAELCQGIPHPGKEESAPPYIPQPAKPRAKRSRPNRYKNASLPVLQVSPSSWWIQCSVVAPANLLTPTEAKGSESCLSKGLQGAEGGTAGFLGDGAERGEGACPYHRGSLRPAL